MSSIDNLAVINPAGPQICKNEIIVEKKFNMSDNFTIFFDDLFYFIFWLYGGFMKKTAWLFVEVILFCIFCSHLLAQGEMDSLSDADYVIGPGDVLDISVWKEAALTKLVTVTPDGKISFPLIGAVTAGGRTLADLTKELEEKLSRFVPDLNLSVVVNQVNSLTVYVIGRVNNPGQFVLNANIDVLQALAMAGGLTPFAEQGNIKIFRERKDGKKVFKFDYDDVSSGKKLEQNIKLKRGDVIVVP
jgi:polysaccharide export outer membrane protein